MARGPACRSAASAREASAGRSAATSPAGTSASASIGSRRRPSTLLRTTTGPRGWGPPLPVGAGTYHALFPRAWFDYAIPGAPLRVVEEQLTPIIPGDDAAASLPVGVFSFELSNTTDRPIDAAVLCAWHDVLPEVIGRGGRLGDVDDGDRRGFVFTADGPGDPGSLAVLAEAEAGEITRSGRYDVEDGGQAWAPFAADGRLRPSGAAKGDAAAVAVRIRLEPGATRLVRFVLAWDVPVVRFGAGRGWYKRYTREWGRTGDGAARIAAAAAAPAVGTAPPESCGAAIDAWQAPYLAAPDRPDWYKAALFNELYFVVDGGTLWHDGPVEPSGDIVAPAEMAFLECVDYPFYDTLDVHFYAASAIERLWPRAQASISRAYARTVALDDPTVVTIEASGERAVRKIAGALPHDLGGPAEDPFARVNHYTFQEVNGWKDLNPKFVLQAWRDRDLDADPDAYVREIWPAVVAAMDHVQAFDRDGDGLPEHDGRPDQTYDTWPMSGPSAYGGSLWLAALRAASAFAGAVGDRDRAEAWEGLFARAQARFEVCLWNGRSYDYDASGGPTSDSVMADQLVGQWFADVCGLGDIVPPDHTRSALLRIHELNVCDFGDGLMGAVNGMRPDGTIDRSSEQSQEVWVGTTYALAAFMIGRGLVDEGWQTAEGAARVVWQRGLWFRTPEAFDRNGDFRASIYLRPLAIWAIEEALERLGRSVSSTASAGVSSRSATPTWRSSSGSGWPSPRPTASTRSGSSSSIPTAARSRRRREASSRTARPTRATRS
jgi:non-lysosomal glucosylceramidase